MPTQYDMKADSEIYRATLEYEAQPMRSEPNPHYDPNFNWNGGDRKNQPWAQVIRVPDGPEITKERVIGPYQSVTPIKAYVTRNRGRASGKNLRIKKIERACAWEEVDV